MKRILAICGKDLRLIFKDRAALIFMLLAPFLLTLGMGAVTGSLPGTSQPSTGLADIPVVIVNQDTGELGKHVVEAFSAEELAGLFAARESSDVAAARKAVEDDQVAAAIFIPAGFSASILPDAASGQRGSLAPIEVYTSRARPVSADVTRSVVMEIVSRMDAASTAASVSVTQLLASGRLHPNEIGAYVGQLIGQMTTSEEGGSSAAMRLELETNAEQPQKFNLLSYLAPGMAVFFLMYTTTQGGRSILAERDHGTLARMLVSPANNAEILGGKLLSIFAAGLLQMGILIVACSLLFGLQWGDPLALAILVGMVVLAATGWGVLLAAVVKTSFQAASVGTALMLLFGILGGTFLSVSSFSAPVRLLSRLTPNAWAMDGFTTLALGGGLNDLLVPLAALLAMSVVLFVAAVLVARRRWASGFMP